MIPIAKPYLTEKEAKAAYDTTLSGWVTQGPKVKEFEDAFSTYVGSKYACALSSCTTALHLSLKVVGVKPGDVVITVSHSFIATANSIRQCGAEPVFIDIDPHSYNICIKNLEICLEEDCIMKDGVLFYKDLSKICPKGSPLNAIKEDRIGRVGAILPVHQMGMPCEIENIISISKKYNIPVVEDAACAIGSEIYIDGQWEKIGRPRGEIACFSFHPRKVITTGEGGMLTTNNEEYYNRIRLFRHHGMNISDTIRHNSNKLIIEEYLETGYNYRMTDIQASIGIEQLKKLPKIIEKRQQINRLYRQYLGKVEWLELPFESDYVKTNWQSYPIKIIRDPAKIRNCLIQYLFDNNITSKPGIMNAHLELPYFDSKYSLLNSENAREQVILLPLYFDLEEGQIKKICQLITNFYKESNWN